MPEYNKKKMEYNHKYTAANYKSYLVRMSLNYDKDIIEELSKQDSVNGYIRQLIRADIARRNGEPVQADLESGTAFPGGISKGACEGAKAKIRAALNGQHISDDPEPIKVKANSGAKGSFVTEKYNIHQNKWCVIAFCNTADKSIMFMEDMITIDKVDDGKENTEEFYRVADPEGFIIAGSTKHNEEKTK